MTRLELARYRASAKKAAKLTTQGRLSEVVGLVLEARGCAASIGDLVELRVSSRQEPIRAEVVGLRNDRTLLMPWSSIQGLEVGVPVRSIGRAATVPVGVGMLGRVIDALGRPIDGKGPVAFDSDYPLHGVPANPLQRRPVRTPLSVGVRAIDGLLSLGEGQRIGIFAGAGVGKSSLLGMLVRNAQVDASVIALIGERSREVEEFVHNTLGENGLKSAVVIAATSADPPLLRARGALYATSIAEHLRAQGKRVLLVMDSLTRYAMALREIGLAVGEPPTSRGYTPSVFAALPSLLERAGTINGDGSITGIYTVLVEGDDLADPIGDASRAILDGHIVLSRNLAERGHFPAIDVPKSISRVMSSVASENKMQTAQRARELIAVYREAEDLVTIGAYKKGTVRKLDEAIERMPKLESFLRQSLNEDADPRIVERQLQDIWNGGAT